MNKQLIGPTPAGHALDRLPGLIRTAFLVTLLTAAALQAAAAAQASGISRIVAVGDVHGAYKELVTILKTAGLVDDALAWSGGTAHLISVGDLLDRGDDSRQVMDLMMRLTSEASAAGGAVHVLLGNHEIMNMTGDLRYVSPGEFASYADLEDAAVRSAALARYTAAATDADFGRSYPAGFFGHRAAFTEDGPYGRWLLTLPSIARLNDTVFVHGGLAAWMGKYSIDDVNKRINSELRNFLAARQILVEAGQFAIESSEEELLQAGRDFLAGEVAETGTETDRALKTLGLLDQARLFSSEAPHWYRGLVACNTIAELGELEAVLDKFGADRVVVGHTPVTGGHITRRLDGRVIMIDTAISPAYEGGQPAALVLEGDGMQALYATDGRLTGLRDAVPRIFSTASGMDRAAVENFLRTAEVVSSVDLPDGVTEPRKLTLRQGDITLNAVFKYADIDNNAKARRKKYRTTDSYKFDVAAYRLDRLLDLDMVPVTVLRTVNDREGAVALWIPDSMTRKEIKEQNVDASPQCSISKQQELMYAFDYLISNDDRNLSNMLFHKGDWQLLLIDHSLAFRNRTKWPQYYTEPEFTMPAALAERLAALSETGLAGELGTLL
ncbi:MAG: metallophosphoesterase, partial [Gammaproteobacteria bacterium]|nr:metallophosphoesterase [Gammaproteobacteria bacterium]